MPPLAIERERKLKALVGQGRGERCGQFGVGRVNLLISIGELAIAIDIQDDRLSFRPTIASIVVVRFFYFVANSIFAELLNSNLGIRDSHHLVADDSHPLVVVHIVDRLPDEESVVGHIRSATVDFEHFVVVVRKGERCFPTPVVDIYIHCLQPDLNTAVEHRPHVGNYGLSAGLKRQLYGIKKVFGNLIVEIKRTCDAVANKAEVKSRIPLITGLPCQVRVNDGVRIVAGGVTAAERIVDRTCNALLGSIVANTAIITRYTIR